MAKETVRYPDALVARIEAFVNDSSAFESKSEYHRFASEFLLSLLDPDHEPSVLGYGEIFDDLGTELEDVLGEPGVEDERFLETYIRVRRHLLHGEHDEARVVVDEMYDVTDREALLLDELIGQSRAAGMEPSVTGARSSREAGHGPGRPNDRRHNPGSGSGSGAGGGPRTETSTDTDTETRRVGEGDETGSSVDGVAESNGSTDPPGEAPVGSEH
jgi:hypothetical protein